MSHTRSVTRVTCSSLLDIMPGPCNNRRKKKQQSRRDKKHHQPVPEFQQPPPQIYDLDDTDDDLPPDEPPYESPRPCDDGLFIAAPNIYDPGNGPRVRDPRAFLSSFFALPPALDDELCAEFSQEEILQMLCTVLPEDYAIVRTGSLFESTLMRVSIQILWYNKSRAMGRVCPSCRRLYSLGDVLPDLVQETPKFFPEPRSPYLAREQEISGLCRRLPSPLTMY